MFAMAVIFQFGLNLQYLDFFQNCPSLKQLKLEAKVDAYVEFKFYTI